MDPRDVTTEHEAQARRDRLRALMDRLEAAMAEPAGRDPSAWRAELRTVCDDLSVALDDHVADTEGADGLFAELMGHSPRLAHRIDRLRTEHPVLLGSVADLRTSLEPDPPSEETVAAAREQGVALLTQLLHHRQQGADLLYEAFWRDVSPGD